MSMTPPKVPIVNYNFSDLKKSTNQNYPLKKYKLL